MLPQGGLLVQHLLPVLNKQPFVLTGDALALQIVERGI